MKRININIFTNKLLFDITFSTYMVGEGLTEMQAKERYMVQSATDSDREGKIYRLIDTAWHNILEQLSAYIEDVQSELLEVDNLISIPESLTISLNIDSAIPNHSCEAITSYIHNYIVNYALWNWFLLTKRDEVDIYIGLANKDMSNIIRIVTMRNSNGKRGLWKLL
ncbi:MAG: hypothetical protein R3Y22_04580 [Bacteroidales bacterium]